jgi:hypothetical protein
MRMIRALRGFLYGLQWRRPGDVFEAEAVRAADLVKARLAEYMAEVTIPPIEAAVDPSPAKAEKAVARRQK